MRRRWNFLGNHRYYGGLMIPKCILYFFVHIFIPWRPSSWIYSEFFQSGWWKLLKKNNLPSTVTLADWLLTLPWLFSATQWYKVSSRLSILRKINELFRWIRKLGPLLDNLPSLLENHWTLGFGMPVTWHCSSTRSPKNPVMFLGPTTIWGLVSLFFIFSSSIGGNKGTTSLAPSAKYKFCHI